MIDNWVKEGLALSIILLFIGVSFQPVFAVDIKLSDKTVIESKSGNDEKVEYVIQIVKTNKVIEHKIYLTQPQADELENLIDNIRADLNNSESIEETSEIYNNAINSFNNMGLFPKDITIDEIKQLVFGETQKLNLIKFKNEMLTEFENRLCLVAGETINTYFLGPALLLFGLMIVSWFGIITLLGILDSFIENFTLIKLTIYTLFFLADIFCLALPLLLFSMYSVFPVSIGSIVTIGEMHWFHDYENEYYPANGWINTVGTNGKKNFSGSFYGKMRPIPFPFVDCYTGIVGFTGIRIQRENSSNVYYQGFALKVGITTDV